MARGERCRKCGATAGPHDGASSTPLALDYITTIDRRSFHACAECTERLREIGRLSAAYAGRPRRGRRPWVVALKNVLAFCMGRSAARAPGSTGPRAAQVVPDLAGALRDESPEARRAAAEALGEVGQDAVEAITALAVAVADRHLDVRLAAAAALERIDPKWAQREGARRAVQELTRILGEQTRVVTVADSPSTLSPWIERYAAAEALGTLGSSAADAVGDLVMALADPDLEVRLAATSALERVDAEWAQSDAARRAVPDLVSALTGRDAAVREGAAAALPHIDPEWPRCEAATKALSHLVDALADEDRHVRLYAAYDLGHLGGPAARAAPAFVRPPAVIGLVQTLADPHWDVRDAAAEVLGKIDPGWAESESAREAVPDLTAALDDPNTDVSSAAAKALERIGPQRADGRPASPGSGTAHRVYRYGKTDLLVAALCIGLGLLAPPLLATVFNSPPRPWPLPVGRWAIGLGLFGSAALLYVLRWAIRSQKHFTLSDEGILPSGGTLVRWGDIEKVEETWRYMARYPERIAIYYADSDAGQTRRLCLWNGIAGWGDLASVIAERRPDRAPSHIRRSWGGKSVCVHDYRDVPLQ